MDTWLESPLIVVLPIATAVVVIGTSIWVFLDAIYIGVKPGQLSGLADMGPVGWLFCCLGLWIVAFPYYLCKREEFQRISQFGRPKTGASLSQIQQRQLNPVQQPPPSWPAPQRAPTGLAEDFDDQLRKLARLKEEGIISEEEFTQKKKELLGI